MDDSAVQTDFFDGSHYFALIDSSLMQVSRWDSLYADLKDLRKKIKVEEETNELESKRVSGEPIAYGTVIQLKHGRSAKFVSQVGLLSFRLQQGQPARVKDIHCVVKPCYVCATDPRS